MELIIKNPKFQADLACIAEESNANIESVQTEAYEYLKELESVHQPLANIFGVQSAQYILSRGYDKTIDVNTHEIKKLAKIMRKHPVAFVMTHKTYIDMFVLAVVLARHGLPLPFTFAGDNLNFPGLGQFAKNTGVIFIKRGISENKIYRLALRHFIAHLVQQKEHFMWSIEGTRSRTGKLVWPKMGILKYIMDASDDVNEEVKYIPISIVYDLIVDVKEMTREGRGKAKKAESLTWLLGYVKSMGDDFGKISIRIGDPVPLQPTYNISSDTLKKEEGNDVSKFALELVHKINQVTPVTTTSLVCISLLSKFALGKRAVESDVVRLMELIESQKPDALVDRGKPIGETVKKALQLLRKDEIIRQKGDGIEAKYIIANDNYLAANYYANMSVHHLYHQAFIELAIVKMAEYPPENRQFEFWKEIMALRDIFKFEFFYSKKTNFSSEIENNLDFVDPDWSRTIKSKSPKFEALLKKQKLLVAPVVLHNYLEAYRVVMNGLLNWKKDQKFNEKTFIENCLFLGEEMQWQGRIHRIESVSKPFLKNGIRLAKNLNLLPSSEQDKSLEIQAFIEQLDALDERVHFIQQITLNKPADKKPEVPVERDIVPGSKTEQLSQDIMDSESGAHIGAFFDLDRTLIKDFSAKEFFQSRLLSGKVTAKELMAQLSGIIVYASGNGNFAGLAAISAKGIKGINEKVFIDLGEDVYEKHLAKSIFPESRALVAAHIAKGHTVAIISAATPYQVRPIARDLAIDHIMCTELELENKVFTGNIVEPACWGEGKATAARTLSTKYKLDLSKSYFYTDSIEDLPLLDIVGHPRPLNPDFKLSAKAFEMNWPVYRFNDESRNTVIQIARTGLAITSMVPAAMFGATTGAMHLSWKDGINSMMATVGDLVCNLAGIKLAVKGEEHLWTSRPAVFIFNHQSSADLFIAAKLVRKNARGIAKKELQMTPIIGQLMMAAGVIFLDRSNKEKAIEAMKPAVEALKNGTSILIFPEGTRSYSYDLGEFKKGAFHLAMQAGVPIVPVIIKNAHDAMPRGTNIFRPALIEVTVMEPIETKEWERNDLNDNIADIRNLYLTELGQVADDEDNDVKASSSN